MATFKDAGKSERRSTFGHGQRAALSLAPRSSTRPVVAMRNLGARGDIIKTMHRAMSGGDRDRDVTSFAIHGEKLSAPILGRLFERGLHDELKGTAYVVVDGIDGRMHHVVFADLDLTGDAKPGAIVETRVYDDADGRRSG